MVKILILVLSLSSQSVLADVYMQMPRGSNNPKGNRANNISNMKINRPQYVCTEYISYYGEYICSNYVLVVTGDHQ